MAQHPIEDFDPLGHSTPAADLEVVASLLEKLAGDAVCGHLEKKQPLRVAEVGVWAGQTTRHMVDHRDCVVYAVDHWRGNPDDDLHKVDQGVAFRTFCKNMGPRLGYSVFPCVGTSLMWAEVWQIPLDMVYIDASHDYENVKADIEAWLPHVRNGGIIAGHDWNVFEGVDKAVVEAFAQKHHSKDNVTFEAHVWWHVVNRSIGAGGPAGDQSPAESPDPSREGDSVFSISDEPIFSKHRP